MVNSKSTAVHVTNAGEEPANEATSSEQNSNRFALPLKIQQGNILWRMARPCLNVWSRKRGSEDGVYLWNGMCIVCGREWRPTCSALTSYCVVSAAMSCCKTNAIFSWSYGVTCSDVMWCTKQYQYSWYDVVRGQRSNNVNKHDIIVLHSFLHQNTATHYCKICTHTCMYM